MSELLRTHIQDFGFKHAEIARRAAKLNQATTYRVVEGETQNPSLNSITGIIEAISLTDADAGVLYRKFGVGAAKPRLFVLQDCELDYEAAKAQVKNHLDSGYIRDAAHGVMTRFDLAESDEQFFEVYEQAGIVYMGLGRWEEAQANFEAADARLRYDVHDPKTPADIIDRKHTLMTNIGSLMVKRGNLSWAMVFAQSIVSHPKVSPLNRGWGYLVLGEASLGLGNFGSAAKEFSQALQIFESIAHATQQSHIASLEERERILQQSQGNIRWTRIHLLKARLRLGELTAAAELKELEVDWWDIDPEASTMAGLFYAEILSQSKRRSLLLRDLQSRARRYGLGEILQRIAPLLTILMVMGLRMPAQPHFDQQVATTATRMEGQLGEDIEKDNSSHTLERERRRLFPAHPLSRGNTGKK